MTITQYSSGAKGVEEESLKRLLKPLARRARLSRASRLFFKIIFLNLGVFVLIGILIVVFFAGVIPSGTFYTIVFWYIVFQISGVIFVPAGIRVASHVSFSRKLSAAVSELPGKVLWVYKATSSGVWKNAYFVHLRTSDKVTFELKCSEEEADGIIDSFSSLFPDVSRGWDESAEARFKRDPAELRLMPVYTEKVRIV